MAFFEKVRRNIRLLRRQFYTEEIAVTPCDVCGNVELNWDRDWSISDAEWEQVVPEKWRDSTLCPWCFVRFAAEKGIDYEVVYYDDIAVAVRRRRG